MRLARIAADSGFDCLWSVEDHFNDYSFVPDNIQLMTYLAPACPNIDLGTAAVILPWHDPLRVAEQAAVLDLPRNRIARPRIDTNSMEVAFSMSTFAACSSVS